jgi:acyl carrier protein
MSRDEITTTLQSIFREVFHDDKLVIADRMTAADVEAWDSLSNIQMILEVETAFRLRLAAAQVSDLADVGDLISLIESKLSAKAA